MTSTELAFLKTVYEMASKKGSPRETIANTELQTELGIEFLAVQQFKEACSHYLDAPFGACKLNTAGITIVEQSD